MSSFDEAKQILNIRQVLEFYGLRFKKNKAICPFHSDKHPSLHINDSKGIYKCFVCDDGGDFIHFVSKHFGVSSFEALKKINNDFHLGLDVGELKTNVRSTYKAQQLDRELYDRWEKRAFDIVIKAYKETQIIIDESEVMSDVWVEAKKKIEYLDFLSDVFIYTGNETEEERKMKLLYKKVVDRLAP